MIASSELESLIAVKRREIEKEKLALGLIPSQIKKTEDKENYTVEDLEKEDAVSIVDTCGFNEEQNEIDEKDRDGDINTHDEKETELLDERLPAGLERYIRRYIGLPGMLKAGEYSPNNPLIRGERTTGDVLLGLGEYERRRNTLRKLQQKQYREYLDQQAKKKQEAKEQAERERKEREEKERLKEEKERARLLEQDGNDRIASVCYVPEEYDKFSVVRKNNTKVDTGVQVGNDAPLSVAVQTDDQELFDKRSPSPRRTPAERELSPRAVPRYLPGTIGRNSRDKLTSELRHTYMPSIFDAEAISMRNQLAEKEAQQRRQFYKQELQRQIQEQKRLKEERRVREKMLEKAELRRVEEQLRVLKEVNEKIKENTTDFDKKRSKLQKEIDLEQQKFMRSKSQPTHSIMKRNINTSQSENIDSNVKLKERKPYSTNIPENSIFSENYDVDSYLRKNLNPPRDLLNFDIMTSKSPNFNINIELNNDSDTECEKQTIIERAQIHDCPKERNIPKYEPSFLRNIDDTPIPVLRHSPKLNENELIHNDNKMKLIEDKWQVPAVQRNILKTLPSEKGNSLNILTQLGSIRRQLQLEQLRLDKAGK